MFLLLLCFYFQSRAFEKTAKQVKEKKRWENRKTKMVLIGVGVAVVVIVVIVIICVGVSQ